MALLTVARREGRGIVSADPQAGVYPKIFVPSLERLAKFGCC